MKLRHFFTLGICFLAFGFSQQIYAQDMGAVDEAVVEETEGVESGEEKSDEAVKKQNIFVRVANVFMNLPFGYDLGSEPTLHGSLTYFNLKYRWSDEKQIFSRLNFYYGTTLNIVAPENMMPTANNSNVKKYQREQKAIDFRLIPWGKQINSRKVEARYFTIEPGLNFRIEPEKTEYCLDGFLNSSTTQFYYTLDATHNRNRFIIRPFYSASLFTPVGKPFSVTIDALYAPFYFYWGKNTIDYHMAGFGKMEDSTDPSYHYETESLPTIKTDYNGFAENYTDVNLVFGLFNFVALSGRLIYERHHKTDYELNSDFKTISNDNIYEKLTLKTGGSLINIGKASMRIKAGVFYQWEWEYNHNADTWSREGKWIFGVGMRNLY